MVIGDHVFNIADNFTLACPVITTSINGTQEIFQVNDCLIICTCCESDPSARVWILCTVSVRQCFIWLYSLIDLKAAVNASDMFVICKHVCHGMGDGEWWSHLAVGEAVMAPCSQFCLWSSKNVAHFAFLQTLHQCGVGLPPLHSTVSTPSLLLWQLPVCCIWSSW